jgi:IS1 family transposase
MDTLEAEADAMWSVVQKKANQQWLWLAMDATTRQLMAVDVGARSRASATALWSEISTVYQEHAIFHPDHYDVYNGVMPAERHKAITKQARTTNHIERFNTTLRQRLARLVRDTLSFSKKVEHHSGAIKCLTFPMCHCDQISCLFPKRPT